MNTYDPQKAARVWQRVQGQGKEQPPCEDDVTEDLNRWILQEQLTAQAYRRLQSTMGQKWALLQKLEGEECAHGACLRGMQRMADRKIQKCGELGYTPEPPEQLLRRCYARTKESMGFYQSKASDPEYGGVFARMAKQEQEHCAVLLELLGSLGEK